jgi:DNA-directed RNA polymerase specialized sigma24 family protein
MLGQADQEDAAGTALASLYRAHALSLTRLAHVMLGDRAAAEDVVQDAFIGLHRNWHKLTDPAKAPQYLRSSVLNGVLEWITGSAHTHTPVKGVPGGPLAIAF